MSEAVRLSAYLERIGFAGSIAPTLPTLEALHALQPATIPFENLDSLLGRPVPLDQASLNQKLLGAHRGGYCFELNLLLLRVLRELGFEARGHLAGVVGGGAPAENRAPDHMVLTVDIAGTSYLADVGFGGLLMTAPLKLKSDVEQETGLGRYRLGSAGQVLQLDFRAADADWRPVYRFVLDPVDDETYDRINADLNADPDWFFHHHLLVERAPPSGRQMLFDNRLTSQGATAREVRHIGSLGELRDTLAGGFGISLGGLDELDAALVPLLAAEAPAL